MIKSYLHPQPGAVKKADENISKKKPSNLAGTEIGKNKSEKVKKALQRNFNNR
ncbi:hypothetical protein Lnau_0821 [Legionella nautarum]|uniref:Uncharacterized protein n=1 Tax=Legionella nautarum TaxID=45070 RepID=A0A0W0WU42_9GAMM|nr:hypothetical protein [Legionella nautarum]KTD35837.1 hypothetical protein Lnau_0821 [Legionella nautarum]